MDFLNRNSRSKFIPEMIVTPGNLELDFTFEIIVKIIAKSPNTLENRIVKPEEVEPPKRQPQPPVG